MDAIYLDCNATTSLAPGALEAMLPYLGGLTGNASSSHRFGQRARQALDSARERLAHLLGAHPDEVLFTSGATEANNLALHGLAGDPPAHLLGTPLEHPSVSEPLSRLARAGFELSLMPVTASGRIDTAALPLLLRPATRLVTCQLVNHETGVVQPVAEVRQAVGEGRHFHCDASQAVGKIPIHFHTLGVSTLALSAHKFHGPPGIGALLVRRGLRLRPLLVGGHQQRGQRAGTEAVALIVGCVAALELACLDRERRLAHATRLRQLLLDQLQAQAAPVVVNGEGLPFTLNVSFPGLAADLLLVALDLAGVACSTGSACSSGSLLPSPTLAAMQVGEARLRSALRFSFSGHTTTEEVTEAGRRISRVVQRFRSTSPGS
ncbi:MAG: cysteine desulfurase family protein [Gemmataceae bacterium]